LPDPLLDLTPPAFDVRRRGPSARRGGAVTVLLNLLLGLGFVAAVGSAVHFWRIHLDAARQDAMQAVAARRGWALTVTGERLGRTGTLRLVPRGGLPWLAEARPKGAAGGPATSYEAEAPRWAEGTLLMIAAPLPGAAEAGALPAVEALRDLLGEETARLAETLRVAPGPEGVAVLSDANPTLRVDLGDLAQALRGWVPVAPGPRGLPVLVLSPEGLRLRLRHPIRRPEQMERFLDLALELSRLIGPGR
jgi:hypothetical protein